MSEFVGRWVGPANDPRKELGVFLYQCDLKLDEAPETFLVRVSADQRYKLFVNDQPVARGPQRGDERHWFFETIDLAPFLKKGSNRIEALVWNFGRMAPMAQHTVRTAFLCEVVDQANSPLNTPGEWQVAPLPHWDFAMMHSHDMNYYIDVGPGEIYDASRLESFAPTGRIAGTTDQEIGRTVRRLLERMCSVSGSDAIAVMLIDPLSNWLRGSSLSIGLDDKALKDLGMPIPEGANGHTLAATVADALAEREPGTRIAAPLIHEVRDEDGELVSEETVGVVVALIPRGEAVGEWQVDFIENSAKNVATIIANVRHYVEEVWKTDSVFEMVEQVFRSKDRPGRMRADSDPSQWLNWRTPHDISAAELRGAGGGGTPWMLIPATLPPQDYTKREARPVVRSFEDDAVREGLLLPRRIEPGQQLLLDYQELLCAYPRLGARPLDGSTKATLTLTYSESLWQNDGDKGNRDEVAGKVMQGYQDKVVLGRHGAQFEPLWWRTYRYLQIETDAPVILDGLDAIETGYPLQVESSFVAEPSVQPLWDVSVRTAQRCAGETYFDCPYWEQLQYVGDTRIQALIGYYLGRDRQLQRNAVEQIGWSLMENGLTQSRYPSRQTQVIPPFSLWWVMMLYDQMLFDRAAVKTLKDPYRREGFSDVCHYFLRAMLFEPKEQFWNFADWVPGWHAGVPPGGTLSTVHYCTFFMAKLADTVKGEMLRLDKMPPNPDDRSRTWRFPDELAHARDGALTRCSSDNHWQPSEHAEALRRCYQIMCGLEVDAWPTEALEAANAAKCTYYFSYYKHLAMAAADPDFDYAPHLQPWREMIESGLTTFAENPEPTRSDCHAWSAHPILGFFQIVAGVTSLAPGWTKARIAPHPGSFSRFDARIAHPSGELRVQFEGDKLEIDTPVPATLVWHGKTEELAPGSHRI